MPAEISQPLFDALIRAHIDVSRYASQQVVDTLALLNDADREIMAKIIARGEDGTFTARRLNALLKEIRQIVDDSYWQAEKRLHDEMGGFALHSSESMAELLSTQVPVQFAAVAMTREQLAAIVDRTPISIGVEKKLLLEEVFSSIAAGKEEAIRGAVRLGMVSGESVADITRRLMGTRAARYKDGILETHRRAAESVVRTITQSVNNTAVQATYAKNADIVSSWVYVSTMDGRVCSYCWSHSSQVYPLGSGPIPPLHINCRCFAAPQLKTWKELGVDAAEMPAGKRATATGVVDADISFNDWLKGQGKELQTELLGPTRQKLFADGGLKLDKFTDASGKMYDLATLKERQSAAFKAAFGN